MASTRDIITAVLLGDFYTTLSTRLKCLRRDISTDHKPITTHLITLHSLTQTTDQALEELKTPFARCCKSQNIWDLTSPTPCNG